MTQCNGVNHFRFHQVSTRIKASALSPHFKKLSLALLHRFEVSWGNSSPIFITVFSSGKGTLQKMKVQNLHGYLKVEYIKSEIKSHLLVYKHPTIHSIDYSNVEFQDFC